MSTFKAAYLIHGDDHGRVGERRARLRAVAEHESGSGGVEIFEGEASTPAAVALALAAMTFAIGRRFLIVDGVERWRDGDVESELGPALAAIAPDTTVAFFAREEGGRAKAPAPLAKAVTAAGGDVVAEHAPKARDLPRWAVGQAESLGLVLDGAGARALVAHVGERRQRLSRELEKLAIEHGDGARIGVEEVDAVAAHSAESEVWGLVDALVAGDRAAATRAYLTLRSQGEALARLVPLIARRIRDVLAIADSLGAGESPSAIKGALRMSPWAADRRIKEAQTADAARLRAALEALSELELAARGESELGDDSAAVLAIAAIAS